MIRQLLLRWQLRQTGADSSEAKALSAVAQRLGSSLPGLEPSRKDAIAQQIGFKPAHVKQRRRLAVAGGFAVVVIVVLLAQVARPGTPLYAIKRGTETVRLTVQPGYQADVVERRKAELDDLKRSDAGKAAIEHAKDDLDRAKDDYKRYRDQSKSADDNSGKGSSRDDSEDNSGSGGSGGSSGSGRDHSEDD